MTTLPPVTAERIKIASKTLDHADTIAEVCREVGVPFYVSCALFEQESKGRNGYGHDAGGALAGFPEPVSKANFLVFRWLVFEQGHPSNGVGPAQITYKGYFLDMEKQGLKPWVVRDNMHYGLTLLLKAYLANGKKWQRAGEVYNGGPGKPSEAAVRYGKEFQAKIDAWKKAYGIK